MQKKTDDAADADAGDEFCMFADLSISTFLSSLSYHHPRSLPSLHVPHLQRNLTNTSTPPTAKSKKQRRLAMKRARAQEAKLLASGDLEALAPKIPLQKQSLNLPGSVNGGVQDAVLADDKREELRKAMRKERKAKIKEANYLKAM